MTAIFFYQENGAYFFIYRLIPFIMLYSLQIIMYINTINNVYPYNFVCIYV